jgi:hypothetical protein
MRDMVLIVAVAFATWAGLQWVFPPQAEGECPHADDYESVIEGLEDEVGKLTLALAEERAKVVEIGQTALEFKREMDSLRAQAPGPMTGGVTATPSEGAVPITPAIAAAPATTGPSVGEAMARADREQKLAVLERNLRDGKARLDAIRNEAPSFKERTGAKGAKGGIRTSDADRRIWERDHADRLAHMENYVAAVEAEIEKLGQQQ